MGKRMQLISEVTGKVWKVERAVGDQLAEGDALIIVESMKMEIPIEAPCAGKLVELRCVESEPVQEGQVVAVLEVQ
jgi:acetyl-CoA carboxylase biotin carboxyl carrier protein